MSEVGSSELGEIIHIDYRSPIKELELAKIKAIGRAFARLPKGSVFEIRCRMYPDPLDDFMCERWGIAWYYNPYCQDYTESEMVNETIKNGQYVESGGYVLIARLKT